MPDLATPKSTTVQLKTKAVSKLQPTIIKSKISTSPKECSSEQADHISDSDFIVDNVNQELDSYQQVNAIDRTQDRTSSKVRSVSTTRIMSGTAIENHLSNPKSRQLSKFKSHTNNNKL